MNTANTKCLNFRPLSIEDKKIYNKYELVANGYYGGEYNFSTIFLENVAGEAQIAEYDGMVFVKTKFRGKLLFYPPLLKNENMLPQALEILKAEVAREGASLEVLGVEKKQVAFLKPESYTIAEEQSLADYVYLSDDLINLTGKKFHSKRNFINRFDNTYEGIEKRIFDESADRAAILALCKKWTTNTQHEKWEYEEKSIERALDNRHELNLKIAVLYVEKKLIAFSISAIDNNELGITFFEKADTDFKGAYQVINQYAAETFFKDVKYINRQYDMGIEGLRKAKESYNPVMMIAKCRIKAGN